MTLQSLDRGLKALEILCKAQHPLGVTEMAQSLDTYKSTAHRILSTLQSSGFVHQREDQKYELGFKLIEIGNSVQVDAHIRATSKRFLAELVEKTGETASLGQFVNGSPVIVECVLSPSPLVVSSPVGKLAPGHATAHGKVLLASLGEVELNRFLQQSPLGRLTPNTITDASELHACLAQVRKVRLAIDNEERWVGIRCVAAPVYVANSGMVVSIGVSCPAQRTTMAAIESYVPLVKDVGFRLSQMLGYTGEY